MSSIRRLWHFAKNAKTINSAALDGISPFVDGVLRDNRYYYIFDRIEQARTSYLHSKEEIAFMEMGAGSKKLGDTKRKVSDIAKTSLSPMRTCKWLFNTAKYCQADHILELGSSLGISTAYLAAARPKSPMISMEGNPACAEYTRDLLKDLGLNSAKVITGNFDNKLDGTLQEMAKVDLAYMDGNHSYDATIRYFEAILPYLHERTIIVLDDIYWSDGMLRAWEEIKKHPQVSHTVDVYHQGFVFFDSNHEKAHWKVIPIWRIN